MIDLDAVIDGKEGSPRLTDLLKMAEEHHKKQGQEGADGKIVNLLEMQTLRDGTQKIKPTVPNLLVIMEKDKRWKKKVWLNEFSNAIYLDKEPLKDTDYTRVKRWMYNHYSTHFSTEAIVEATNFIAEQNGKNPLCDWLNDVVWDGVLIKESMWAFARETSAKENMRQCYEDLQNNTGVANTACEYSQTLFERFAPEKMYKQFADAVYAPSAEEAKWEEELSTVELV